MRVSSTFRDPSREAELAERQYLVLPVLTADEVQMLTDAYFALAPEGDRGLSVDYMRADRSFMHQIAELVAPLWERHFAELFVDHRPVFTTFVTKHPGRGSDMGLHEDRTFVDERRQRAGALWIPLVDVGPDLPNGGLAVIPGSTAIAGGWAGTATPELYREFEPRLCGLLEPLTVPAGHGVYYDTRTLHASGDNLSDRARPSIVCAVAPREAQLIHVVATSRRHRVVLGVDETFFLEVHPHEIGAHHADRYPVIDEYDDGARLEPDVLAEFFGPAFGPTVPPLLAHDPGLTGIECVARQLPLLHADLPVTGADLAPAADLSVPGLTLAVDEGIVGAIAVTVSGSGCDAPPWTGPVAQAVPGGSAALVFVDPGGRATFSVGAADSPGAGEAAPWMMEVVDVAMDAGTATFDSGVVTLDERVAFRIAPGTEWAVANRGPGPAVLLLASLPVPPGGPARGEANRGVLARLRTAARRGSR